MAKLSKLSNSSCDGSDFERLLEVLLDIVNVLNSNGHAHLSRTRRVDNEL